MLNYIYSEDMLDLYSNLSIALHLLLTLPVTVASGERSFSALKLIKSYLRSSMSQERLRGLALISIERNIRRSLNMEDLVTALCELKSASVDKPINFGWLFFDKKILVVQCC